MKKTIKNVLIAILTIVTCFSLCLFASCEKGVAKTPDKNTADSSSSIGGVSDSSTVISDDDSSGEVSDHSSESHYESNSDDSSESSLDSSGGDSSSEEQVTLPPVIEMTDRLYISGDLTVTLYTFDCAITEITIDAAIVPEARYTYDGLELVISGEYLSTFDGKENYTLTVNTEGGSDKVTFAINDTPTISDKTDFIKYPGEKIVGENFTKLVHNKVGSLSVTYSLKEGSGTLKDNGNGTFDYTPSDIFSGQAIITVLAVDEYGAFAEKDVTLIYKTVAPTIEGEYSFDHSLQDDLVVTVKKRGKEKGTFPVEFISLTGNGIAADNYVFDDDASTVTIKAEYLLTLSRGDYTFTLTTTAGSADLIVAVSTVPVITLVSPDNVSEDDDLIYGVSLNGNEFVAVRYHDNDLTEDLCSFDGETLTIRSAFISGLSLGEHGVYFTTDSNSIRVKFYRNDTPIITKKTDFYKLPGEIVTGESFKNYVADSYGKLTLSYALEEGQQDLGTLNDKGDGTFDFTPDGVYAGEVNILFTATDEYGATASEVFVLVYKTVDPVIYDADGKTYLKSVGEDVTMKVDTFGNENPSYYFEMTDILSGDVGIGKDNYVFKPNGDGKYFTIKAAYLSGLPSGEYTFTLTTTAGRADFSIIVYDDRAVEVDKRTLSFVKGTLEDDFSVTVTPYENEVALSGITIENAVFTAGEDVTYEDLVLTFKKSFMNGLNEGSYTIKINGESKITVTVTTAPPVYPTVEAAGEGYRIDGYNDVAFKFDLKGNTFADLLYGDDALVCDEDYYLNDDDLVIRAKKLNDIYRFGQSTYKFRLCVEENDGTEFDVVFENPENRILNGGFETGTLYGWNVYQIWKNESGMLAWTDDRVVSGTYFDGGYSYNRDGNYNLGVYGGKISKDSGQERMGHLRSSDFTLGGSGWISFKLGGGRNGQFAYVSVRKTSDNTEIARFANRHFNDTSLSETENAEAYMFRYYYDLSAYMGESLYFMISDTSSNHWCVLSADSFYTYYENAPATTEATLAENVLPTVKGVSSAANEIVGGKPFAEDTFGAWAIDGEGWGLTGSSVKSNVNGGDKGVGILRSPAFTIDGENKYLRFQFAGTRYFDKTIWVSVKEVGTNIEVKRFVLRKNLVGESGTGTSSYDNHMCDIHDLDESKEYYLEFCDNETGTWGVFYVKEVQLCDQAKWNEKPSGDRAVSISGIVTDYKYILPY